jgi:excisionase family DNA binding protein
MSTEMTQDVNADYVSSPQAAKILRITYVGVAQLARQGKIPAVKIANRWLIPRAFLEEFARTYDGRRGRPRKKGPTTDSQETLAAVRPDQLGQRDTSAASEAGYSGQDTSEISALTAPAGHQVETPTTQPSELLSADTGAVSAAEFSLPETGAVLSKDAEMACPEETQVSATQPTELGPTDESVVSETEDSRREGDQTFAISAQVYHLDKNYDFELYEKGEITERARLIVARLKPKIPSLPQFSFRWDYRYEHLNVDIHGVEPAVVDWWTMGENGYTGHLPRKLGGPGHAFEANIWLPVTFVFRGRLTLSLRDSPEAEEDSSSVATTTGGLRKLWSRWPTIRHS